MRLNELVFPIIFGISLVAIGAGAMSAPRQSAPAWVTMYNENVRVSKTAPYFPSMGPGRRMAFQDLVVPTQVRILDMIEAGERLGRTNVLADLAGGGGGTVNAGVGCNAGPGWIACDFHDFALVCELSWFDGHNPEFFCYHYGGKPIIP